MYKRVFFSQLTATIAMICVLLTGIATVVTGKISGEMLFYDYFDVAVKLVLAAFLFYGYRKQNLIAMQAGCSGLLLCLLYGQAGYVLDELLVQDTNNFIILGFWGSFFLAGELMLLILEFIVVCNHFVINILKKHSFIRISLNQTTILLLLGFLFLQLFVNSKLMFAPITLAYFGVSHLCIISIFVLVACAELIIALDDGNGGY